MSPRRLQGALRRLVSPQGGLPVRGGRYPGIRLLLVPSPVRLGGPPGSAPSLPSGISGGADSWGLRTAGHCRSTALCCCVFGRKPN